MRIEGARRLPGEQEIGWEKSARGGCMEKGDAWRGRMHEGEEGTERRVCMERAACMERGDV